MPYLVLFSRCFCGEADGEKSRETTVGGRPHVQNVVNGCAVQNHIVYTSRTWNERDGPRQFTIRSVEHAKMGSRPTRLGQEQPPCFQHRLQQGLKDIVLRFVFSAPSPLKLYPQNPDYRREKLK